MRFRFGLLVGLGVGYVLGARAGRARYLQRQDRWDELTGSPAVRRAIEPVREAVEPEARTVREATEAPEDTTSALSADQVKERMARTGTLGPDYDVHLPEEVLKERM